MVIIDKCVFPRFHFSLNYLREKDERYLFLSSISFSSFLVRSIFVPKVNKEHGISILLLIMRSNALQRSKQSMYGTSIVRGEIGIPSSVFPSAISSLVKRLTEIELIK